MVGAVDEEVGDYFPEFLDMLEESAFLKVREMICYIMLSWKWTVTENTFSLIF